MYLEFECSDMVDVPDNIECAFSEAGDSTSEVEDMLNDMSLDELYELRDSLTEGDISDTESDADNEIPVVSDMMPLEDELTSDSTNEVGDLDPTVFLQTFHVRFLLPRIIKNR